MFHVKHSYYERRGDTLIEPKTDIRLLTNVPLDPTYNHTIRFTDATSQSTYFANKTKHTLSRQTYQRVQRGYAKVQLSADDCYDCNYMMFRNTYYGSKWFYAFITGVEYLNENACYITFVLDVIQTWWFDFTIRDSMVVREHSATDGIGDNILPEPVKLGEYVEGSHGTGINIMKPLSVVVAICDNNERTVGGLFEGVFSGCVYYSFECGIQSQMDALKELIIRYTESPDSIVAMWMCPTMFIGTKSDDNKIQATEKGASYDSDETFIKPVDPATTSLNGYKPKNNKLYTYPYNYFQFDNGVDNSLVLRYEFFENLTPRFRIEGTKNTPVKACVFPTHYKGSGENPYRMESLNMMDFPMCSWNNDAYKVWLAQNTYINKVKMAQTVVNSTVGAVAGMTKSALSGNIVGVAGEVINAISQPANEYVNQTLNEYSASIQADLFRGTLGNSNLLVSQGENKLFYRRMCIPYEYARSIDTFFTMFGYACNRVKQPNVCSGKGLRPHWNYIQTSGCVARGSVPSPDMQIICKIFDSGITFWENGEEIGNYSYDNSPV
jgi:hypothetical protein